MKFRFNLMLDDEVRSGWNYSFFFLQMGKRFFNVYKSEDNPMQMNDE